MQMRTRNNDGQFRRKRSDTDIKTIENKYGVDFGVRDDMHLNTLLEKYGVDSLNDLITGK